MPDIGVLERRFHRGAARLDVQPEHRGAIGFGDGSGHALFADAKLRTGNGNRHSRRKSGMVGIVRVARSPGRGSGTQRQAALFGPTAQGEFVGAITHNLHVPRAPPRDALRLLCCYSSAGQT